MKHKDFERLVVMVADARTAYEGTDDVPGLIAFLEGYIKQWHYNECSRKAHRRAPPKPHP